ncbi:MAG: hypothetical protein HY554_06850, partial [Elusimicrobia bacterium]|nr:hypothetical protein [Elusimicrobiota bacterium]
MGAWIAVLLAWPAGAALPAPPVELPGWLSQGLAAVDRSMAGVEAGRRLAAASAGLGLEARRIEPEEPALVYRGGERPAIVVDPKRAEGFKELELELAVVRARATARYDVGLSLVEVEQAVEQAVLEYALERALASEAFGAPLKRAVSRSRRSEDVRREAGGAPIPLPLREPERVGELLRRFGDDAEEFYWTIEREVGRTDSLVRLSELEG